MSQKFDFSQLISQPFSSRMGRPPGLNVASTGMKWAQEGMPHEKIVIGLPLFGRSYAVPPSFHKRTGKAQLDDLNLRSLGTTGIEGLQIKNDLDRGRYAGTNRASTSSGILLPRSSVGMIDLEEPHLVHTDLEVPESEERHRFSLDNGLTDEPVFAEQEADSTLPGSHAKPTDFPADIFDALPAALGSPSLGPGMDEGFVPYGKVERRCDCCCRTQSHFARQFKTAESRGMSASRSAQWFPTALCELKRIPTREYQSPPMVRTGSLSMTLSQYQSRYSSKVLSL